MKEPVALQPSPREFGKETWTVARFRLDAEWAPLKDEKKRKVHGYAHIEEHPQHMLGRVLAEGYSRLTISDKAFSVRLIATRDGMGFGASRSATWYVTREEALEGARKALVQQGKRYAKKYGGMA